MIGYVTTAMLLFSSISDEHPEKAVYKRAIECDCTELRLIPAHFIPTSSVIYSQHPPTNSCMLQFVCFLLLMLQAGCSKASHFLVPGLET